jgi:hypothetical protein
MNVFGPITYLDLKRISELDADERVWTYNVFRLKTYNLVGCR